TKRYVPWPRTGTTAVAPVRSSSGSGIRCSRAPSVTTTATPRRRASSMSGPHPLSISSAADTDRVHRAAAAAGEILEDRDVVGGRDVPSAPGEPRRHLHLGPLGTARLEDRDECEPLGVDRAAAADPDRGRRDLSGDPCELEAPF